MGFSLHGQDDLAQAIVVEEDVDLTFKRTGPVDL
jgi:hypothetical protein